MRTFVAIAFALSFTAVPAMAATAHAWPYHDRAGSLSRFEGRQLQQERRYIDHQRRLALRDGRLTLRERQYLRGLELQHRRTIWRDRHD